MPHFVNKPAEGRAPTDGRSPPAKNAGESNSLTLLWLLLLAWLVFSGLMFWQLDAITRGVT